MLTRKEVLQMLSALPVGGFMASQGLAGRVTPRPNAALGRGPLSLDENLFRSIGVEPVINCRGTFTIIGGSIEHPHVKAAMHAASNNFIQYDELAFGIGERLAELTGAEWGMVSAGCAAALKHVTAACVAGGNPEVLIRIPDLRDVEKNEVIMPRHSRNTYDHAIRNIGVKMITVDSVEELEGAMSNRTAMICLMSGRTGPLGLENVSRLAKQRGIPVLVDAAAEDLTIPNVHLAAGADVVAYSGGKALCGPQCAGLVLGDKKLLMSAWQASSPHHGPGRDNKVGREEMIGLLAAVEAWVMRDHEGEWQRWLGWLNHIGSRARQVSGVETEIQEPTGLSNRTPRLRISWDPERFHVTGAEIAEEVARIPPRIALGSGGGPDGQTSLSITSGQMQPGDAEVVAERIHELLSRRRSPKPAMRRAGGTVTGRWIVDIDFYSSSSQHTLFIEEQDGNWIRGAHQGDYTTRDLAGTIEGNEVKLISTDARPGNRTTYIFIGTLEGGALSGRIFMGEYLEAQFSASRYEHSAPRREIMVPDGPPLAT